MLKLFYFNLKMMTRNRQALFWSFAFPLMFTVIFGFFFGSSNNSAGTISLINQSNSQLSASLETAMSEAKLFKIRKDTDLKEAEKLLKNNKITAVVEIPKDFGSLQPNSPTQVKIIQDPSNAQTNMIISSFIDQFLTQANFQIQNAKPIFSVDIKNTTDQNLTYFDFVLLGLIGLALMNSSIQGIAISMAKYREDKILKRITTTPLKTWKFVLAEIFSRLILNLFQVSAILIVGIYFFNAHIYGSFILVFLLALLGGLLFQSIGFFVSSLSKTTDAAQGMSVAIAIPMMFLAGVFFPIDQLPKWLFSIVQYLPLAPLLRMIRQVGLESLSPFTNPLNMVIVIGWIMVTLAYSIFRFRLSDE